MRGSRSGGDAARAVSYMGKVVAALAARVHERNMPHARVEVDGAVILGDSVG